jgi:hypothetical protein
MSWFYIVFKLSLPQLSEFGHWTLNPIVSRKGLIKVVIWHFLGVTKEKHEKEVTIVTAI